MTAATRSRPECSASDKTPKLPVRRTRNAFSDTQHDGRADAQQRRALLFAHFDLARASTMSSLDYLKCSGCALRRIGGTDA